MNSDELKQAATKIDIYGTHRLPYSFFIASSLVAEGLAGDEITGVVFKLLDIDRDGVIGNTDLNDFIKIDLKLINETEYGQQLVAEIKQQADISHAAFSQMVKSAK